MSHNLTKLFMVMFTRTKNAMMFNYLNLVTKNNAKLVFNLFLPTDPYSFLLVFVCPSNPSQYKNKLKIITLSNEHEQ